MSGGLEPEQLWMPVPRALTMQSELLHIGGGLRVAGDSANLLTVLDCLGIPFLQESDPAAADLRIRCSQTASTPPVLGEDESYELTVSRAGGVELEATQRSGLVRGLATLAQMLHKTDGGHSVRCVKIEDRPRFPWRGLLLDVSRHFLPAPWIERTLNAMAAVKLNVLHLHLADDQGFRIESREFPALHELGSGGEFYTQDQIRQLVDHATRLGIRVVPEFDVPGHATSWLIGYPELGTRRDRGYQLATAWGAHDACLDPLDEGVYEFLERFFGEVAGLFPDAWVHIGGDEVTGVEWREDPRALEFLAARNTDDVRELQAWFNNRLREILAGHARQMIGWDELVHPVLPTEVLVQSWRGPESLAGIAGRGHQCIRSHGYYLDHLSSAAAHHRIDPHDGVDATSLERVLGGEACLWTEYVDTDNLDSRLWPRAAAIAERLWSPGDLTDRGLYDRLAAISVHLEGLGCTHRSVYAGRLANLAATGTGTVDSLRPLTDLLAPLPFKDGAFPRQTDRHTCLDRLVDAIPPESLVAREFAAEVARFLDDRRARPLARRFEAWLGIAEAFERAFAGQALHAELGSHARCLAELAILGQAALELFAGGRHPPAVWCEEAVHPVLDRVSTDADLVLQVVEPLRRLLTPVDEQSGNS